MRARWHKVEARACRRHCQPPKASGQRCTPRATSADDSTQNWADSKGLNQWERTALELAEERSQLG